MRKLSLDPLEDEEERFKNLDLKGFEGESNTRGNGTVIRALSEKISEEEGNIKEIEQEKKITEPWVNMFTNNRVTSNGMQLNISLHKLLMSKQWYSWRR